MGKSTPWLYYATTNMIWGAHKYRNANSIIYNTELLPSLSIHQITFVDEMHREQDIGTVGKICYHFQRNASGVYSPNGAYEPPASQMHLKYPDQARLCCGVAPVMYNDGKEKDVRTNPYDYTGKKIITITH